MLDSAALFDLLFSEGLDPEFVEEDTQITVTCTLCEDDRPRLYLSSDTGVWLCFHCGEQGSLMSFFSQVLGYPPDEAFEQRRRIIQFEEHRPARYLPHSSASEVEVPVELPLSYRPIKAASPAAFRNYLKRRHVSLNLAIAFQIGYAVTGPYSGRIIVPVQNEEGSKPRLYTFIARTILKYCLNCLHNLADCVCAEPISKVLTPVGGHPRLTLFNYDAIRRSDSPLVIVTEGVFDALRLPEESVALLGAAISPTQVELLGRLNKMGKQIIICLDGDKAGRQGTKKVTEALLSCMLPVRVAHLPDDTDPNSLDMAVLADHLAQAKEASW